jgi:DNA-binding response OmpR family regulator
MAETHSRPRLVRFGAFEADLQTGELRKDGVKLKFGGQPFLVLAILLERPGDVVTREELQKRLWQSVFLLRSGSEFPDAKARQRWCGSST